jgi:hypothetical protein
MQKLRCFGWLNFLIRYIDYRNEYTNICKLSVSWSEFLAGLKTHFTNVQDAPEFSTFNLRVWQESLDREVTGNVSIYELKTLERNVNLATALEQLIKKSTSLL